MSPSSDSRSPRRNVKSSTACAAYGKVNPLCFHRREPPTAPHAHRCRFGRWLDLKRARRAMGPAAGSRAFPCRHRRKMAAPRPSHLSRNARLVQRPHTARVDPRSGLRSAHRQGRARRAASPRENVSRLRPSQCDSLGQRKPFRFARSRWLVAVWYLARQIGDPSRPHLAWKTSRERSTRANAPDPEGRDCPTAQSESSRSAGRVQPVPPRLQPRATARGSGRSDSRDGPHAEPSPVSPSLFSNRVRLALCRPIRPTQRLREVGGPRALRGRPSRR